MILRIGPHASEPPFTGTFVVSDEDIVLGSAQQINFDGDNVEVVLSGTVAHVMVTGSGGGSVNPPVTGSIVVFDEGIILGSALGFNFSGDNVEAVISGSYVHVMVTGSAGGGGGGGGTPVSVTTGTFYLEEVLYEVTLGSTTGSVIAVGLSQDYDHLKIILNARSSVAAVAEGVYIYLNNDTTPTNYRYGAHYAGTSHDVQSGDIPVFGDVPAASALSNDFGVIKAKIIDYAGATKHKQLLSESGDRHSATNIYARQHVLYWESTAAINRIDFAPVAGNWISGSHFQIIGVKETVLVTDVTGDIATPVTGTFVLMDGVSLLGSVDTLVVEGDQYMVAGITGSTGYAQLRNVTGTWIAPSLLNSWSNQGSPWAVAGYYKDAFGRVHIKGQLTSGTTTADFFVLPVGYRPMEDHLFMIIADGALAQCQVQTDGSVYHGGGANVWLSLAGISFLADG